MTAKRDEKIFLADIIDSVNKIERYIEGTDKEGFFSNEELQDAVIRRIGIIGEAVKNVSKETTTKFPQIEWREFAGMRDVITHQYFRVNLERIWRVIKKELPGLKKDVIEVLEKLGGQIIFPLK